MEIEHLVDQTVATFEAAAAANRATPGRSGCLVTLAADLADEVMITGDLHGHRENFERLIEVADLDRHPRRHLVLQEVCHGGPTYPDDGGCMSHTMLEDVAALKVRYPDRLHLLLGNHELAELADYPIQKNRRLLNLMFRIGVVRTYGSDAERVREAYFAFLRSCPLALRTAHDIFVSHSLPEQLDYRKFDMSFLDRPLDLDDPAARDEVFDLVWGRDYRSVNARRFAEMVGAKVLIHGHQPSPEGYLVPNPFQVILDCCGARAGFVILPNGAELTHAAVVEAIDVLANGVGH
jgi:hypothetical protein